MKRLIALALLAAACSFGAFSYRRKITVASGTVNSTLSNFTRPIHVTFNAAHVASANGYDIGFYTNSDCTGRLDWATISYNSSTGEYWGYLKQTVTSSGNTDAYACYGDAGITTQQNTDADAVDSSTKFYMPLDDPDSEKLNLRELKGKANIEKKYWSTWEYYPVTAAGKLNKSLLFDGTWYGHVYIPSAGIGTTVTVSQWIKTTDTEAMIVAWGDDHNRNGFAMYMNGSGRIDWRGAGYSWKSCSTSVNDGTWHHLAATQTGATLHFYIDGSECSLTGSAISDITDTTGPMTLGAIRGDSDLSHVYYRLSGNIDEFWASTVVRSADWVAAVYASQNDPDTFQSVGSEEEVTGGGGGGGGGSTRVVVGVI